jgi:hypothetical protein
MAEGPIRVLSHFPVPSHSLQFCQSDRFFACNSLAGEILSAHMTQEISISLHWTDVSFIINLLEVIQVIN